MLVIILCLLARCGRNCERVETMEEGLRVYKGNHRVRIYEAQAVHHL
jgi:hypothetical protein